MTEAQQRLRDKVAALSEEDAAKIMTCIMPNLQIIVRIKPYVSNTYTTVCENAEFYLRPEWIKALLTNIEQDFTERVARCTERGERLKSVNAPYAIRKANTSLLNKSSRVVNALESIVKKTA